MTAALQLDPGRYLMTWAGYTQDVTVFRRSRPDGGADPYFVNALGWPHPVATVPDATFTPIPAPTGADLPSHRP